MIRDRRDQRLAVGLVDADDRRRRFRRERLERRRAPDRRADPFVDALARVNVDLCDCAAALECLHGAGHRKAFGEHDPAGHRIGARSAAACRIGRVEERLRAVRVARRDVADLTLNGLGRRPRHRRRTRAHRPGPAAIGDHQLGAFRDADVERGLMKRHWCAYRPESLDQVTAGGVFGRRARFPHQRRETIEQRAGLVEPDRVARDLFECRVLEHRERPRHQNPPSVVESSVEEDAHVRLWRRRRRATDQDERQCAEHDTDFHRIDAMRREVPLQREAPDQAAEEAGHHAADRAFLRAAPPVQAEHDRHEEEAGDELRLLDDDRLHVGQLERREPERHRAEDDDRDPVDPDQAALRGLRVEQALVEIVGECAAGHQQDRVHAGHDRRHHRDQEKRSHQRRHDHRRKDARSLVRRRQVREQPAHADAEDHHARSDQRLCHQRDADRVAHGRDVAHRVVARHLVRGGGNREAERHAERDQLTPAEPPAGHARLDRADVLAERRQPAGMRDDHRHREQQCRHHHDRLHELDVRARPHATDHSVEAGAREQRGHRDERCDAEHRRRDLTDRLELRREVDRVGDDDQRRRQRAGALAGEALADVVGHRQRAEST